MAFQPDGQSISKRVDGRIRTLEVTMPRHRLSWRNNGDASAYLLATSHDTAKWLTLCATEAPNKGAKRTTIVALDAHSAQALFEQLREVFK